MSVALGAALTVIAGALVARMRGADGGGWFMYSPNTNVLCDSSSTGRPFLSAFVCLVAIGIWFGVSWRLFRSPR
jgi:hypothetical protein